MFCPSWGTELAEGARFCHQCGYSAAGGPRAPTEEKEWEYCEISWDTINKFSFWRAARTIFVAIAIGPDGEYVAGESEPFRELLYCGVPRSGHPGTVDAYDGLVKRLLKDGWRATGERGDY